MLTLDTLLGQVNTAHVVPGPIDVSRFRSALARTLSVYVLASGRLRLPAATGEPYQVRVHQEVLVSWLLPLHG
jgi:hypothetical protein